MSSPQIPLALRFPPDQRLDSFVCASPALVGLLGAVARGEAVDWILLAGPQGSGKTHLLLATCAEAEAHGQRVAYLPLAATRSRLQSALDGVEQAGLVALDDLDAVLGERSDEVALFDFHNRARAAGTRVVYSAGTGAASLPVQLPDLRSRLSQCTQLSLPSLDDDGRRMVLRQRAQRRGLLLDDDVLEFLLRRVGRDLAGLTALMDRIDRESLAAQRRVTIPFLRGVM